MSREMTPEELAELMERLRAGDASAIKEAVAACKPKRVPKLPKPKPSENDRLLAALGREVTKAANLIAEIQRIHRAVSAEAQAAKAEGRAMKRDYVELEKLNKLEWDYRTNTEYLWLSIRAQLDRIQPEPIQPTPNEPTH